MVIKHLFYDLIHTKYHAKKKKKIEFVIVLSCGVYLMDIEPNSLIVL